jgi:dienelactone hydrolase
MRLIGLSLWIWVLALVQAPAAYDPLAVVEGKAEIVDLVVRDLARDREIPLRVYLPPGRMAAPVVLFSHGLGGSREGNSYLGNHWAGRGYVAVFLQHPGSDEAVWKEVPAARRMAELNKAASVENFRKRAADVPAVLDALAAWEMADEHGLKGRLDLDKVGMAGHSFGAKTTQVVVGETLLLVGDSLREERIDAAVMMSPSPPAVGDPAAAFAGIRIPCLLMTGTRDDSPIGGTSPADRLRVFPHLRQAPAWQVVFEDGDHMIFGDRGLLGRRVEKGRYHRPILALTTAFWDLHLKQDPAAAAWLEGEGARTVLSAGDRWESRRPR